MNLHKGAQFINEWKLTLLSIKKLQYRENFVTATINLKNLC